MQVDDFERFTLPVLDRVLSGQAGGKDTVFIFDEIGKMELFSKDFVARVRRLLESPDPRLHVLGTVAINGPGFISQSKRLPGVEVVEISVQNRDEKVGELAARFEEACNRPDGAGRAGGSPSPGSPPDRPAGNATKGRWRPKARLTAASSAQEDRQGSAPFEPPARSSSEPGRSNAIAMGKAVYGQLGRGETDLESSGDALGLHLQGAVDDASCGFDHTGLVVEGQLFLCGKNNKGQCARPASGGRADKATPDFSEDLASPQLLEGFPGQARVKQVACGGEHTLVLMDTGEVLSCGSNTAGQLGLGQGSPKMSARLNRLNLPPAQAVSAGFCHSAAICSDRLYMWGDCSQGQLGQGRRQKQVPEPQLLDVGGPVRAVALGRWHSLVLSLGTVWAFGWGRFGVLAQGQKDMDNHVHPVKIEGLPAPIHLLASGAVHCGAVCGPNRECYMWGRGNLGRLGLDLRGEANVATPKPLPGLQDVTALALGGDFSAAKAAGEWWVWGKNEEGQLGQGNANRENVWRPVRAPTLAGFKHVALGDCHALAYR